MDEGDVGGHNVFLRGIDVEGRKEGRGGCLVKCVAKIELTPATLLSTFRIFYRSITLTQGLQYAFWAE